MTSLWPPSSRRILGFVLSCLSPRWKPLALLRPVTHGRPRGRSDWLSPEQRGRRQGEKREESECISLPGSPVCQHQGRQSRAGVRTPARAHAGARSDLPIPRRLPVSYSGPGFSRPDCSLSSAHSSGSWLSFAAHMVCILWL